MLCGWLPTLISFITEQNCFICQAQRQTRLENIRVVIRQNMDHSLDNLSEVIKSKKNIKVTDIPTLLNTLNIFFILNNFWDLMILGQNEQSQFSERNPLQERCWYDTGVVLSIIIAHADSNSSWKFRRSHLFR